MARLPNILRTLTGITAEKVPERLDRADRTATRQRTERHTPMEENLLWRAVSTPATHIAPQLTVDELVTRRMQHGGNNHQENARIIRMSTEVSRAISLMVSSIVSPNDLRKGNIKHTVTHKRITAEQKSRIEAVLEEFYEERFELSTVAERWIHEALYSVGAKIVLTIPMGSIERELLSKESISLEALDTAVSANGEKSLFGLGTSCDLGSIATECYSTFQELAQDIPETSPVGVSSHDYTKMIQDFISNENLEIIDNTDKVRSIHRKSRVTSRKIKQKVDRFREDSKGQTPKQFIQLSHTEKDQEGEPLVLEGPPESCIRIYPPGSPTKPVAYIFALDEHGNLASMDPNGAGSEGGFGYRESDKNNFGAIYGAFGFNNNTTRQSAISSTISHMYAKVVETYLSQQMDKADFDGVEIGSNPAIYRYMFSQYLAQRQSRLLFVPADMVTYFAFNLDEHGNGISKLEDVKYAISLKTTADVAQSMNFAQSSMPKRHVTINSDDKNVQNNLQTMNKIRDMDIRKNSFSLNTNPELIIGQLAAMAYSFEINGTQGFDFKITNEARDRGNPTLDENYITNKGRDVILGLEVPPAAMNQVAEGEYSRSVATTNIVFAGIIMKYQHITIKFISDFVQKYADYSKFIRQEIADILGLDKGSDVVPEKEQGTVSADKSTDTKDYVVDEIINSIQIALPPPRVAPDTAQYETSEKITRWVDETVNAIWPDDIAGNNESAKLALSVKKSSMKHGLITKLLSDIGMPDMSMLDIRQQSNADIENIRQSLINTGAMIMSHDKVLTPPEGETPDSNNDFSSFNAANTGDSEPPEPEA